MAIGYLLSAVYGNGSSGDLTTNRRVKLLEWQRFSAGLSHRPEVALDLF